MDLNYFWKLNPDPDPHKSEKRDPDPGQHESEKLDPDSHQNSKALEALNRAVDAHSGGLDAQNGTQESLSTSGRSFPSSLGREIRIKVKSWIRIRIKAMRIRNPAKI
jgi:hypothetical protein